MDELQQEFHEFQLLEETKIPKSPLNEKYPDMADRVDIVWNRIGEMTSADGTKRFKRLFPIAIIILSLPHSNAEEERLFSMVKGNKTAFCPNLDPQETLGSILTLKLALKVEKIHKMDIPKDILTRAKKATWEYNKAHSSINQELSFCYLFLRQKENLDYVLCFSVLNFKCLFLVIISFTTLVYRGVSDGCAKETSSPPSKNFVTA